MFLRPMTIDDVPFMMGVRNESREMLKDTRAFTVEEGRIWFQTCKPEQYIVNVQDVGDVGVMRVRRYVQNPHSAEIGGDVALKHRGKGYGRRAYNLLIPFLFLDDKILELYLEVFTMNMVAFNLYHSLGFQIHEYVPKMARRGDGYIDGFVMQMSQARWETRE